LSRQNISGFNNPEAQLKQAQDARVGQSSATFQQWIKYCPIEVIMVVTSKKDYEISSWRLIFDGSI